MPMLPLAISEDAVVPFLAKRLAILRHERCLTQRALALQAHISQKQLSQMEHGRQSFLTVASGTVRRLAILLTVTTDYLLGMDLVKGAGPDVPFAALSHTQDVPFEELC